MEIHFDSRIRAFLTYAKNGLLSNLLHLALAAIYSYFEKGYRKSARDNPERYWAWFCIHCFSKKFERMSREAMDVYLRVLKASNKSSFDSFSVRNSVLIICHIIFWGCHVLIFSVNVSRNSCIHVSCHVEETCCAQHFRKR